jgi:23S rRNA pseudouridine1911/1915/1917 synthase
MTRTKRAGGRHRPKGLIILHEDDDILVVDKAPGLLTIGTHADKTNTAYYRLTDYVRKGNAKSRKRVFIVHRLDRDASGLLVFAKTAAAKLRLQDSWSDVKKTYIAVVHGHFAEKSGTLCSYLGETGAHTVYSTKDPAKGKLSRLRYRVLEETADFSLLEIDLLTGRKHQIRVQLADAGHPVAGDRKYGGRGGHTRLALHAKSLAFAHPRTGTRCVYETDTPAYFSALLRRPLSASTVGRVSRKRRGCPRRRRDQEGSRP